jgi:hypothetical protein
MDVPRTPAVLAVTHFASAALGDARRSKRLVRLAEKIFKHPGGSLPDKLPKRADLVAFYRLMDCPKVTHRSVIGPHLQHTREAIAACGGVVLLIHDDTELDYSTHLSLEEDLGSVGNGGRGYICHNTLAVTEDRCVLGLVEQILHKRRDVPKRESPQSKRDHPARQSLPGYPPAGRAGCESTNDLQQDGRLLIDVADRASDTFEFLEYEQTHGRHHVIRVAKDRNLAGEDHVGDDRIHHKLFELTRDLPSLGEQQVQVASTTKKKGEARVATVRLASAPVSIARPHFCRGHCTLESIDAFVIHVCEVNPPQGVQPIEWLLLTNLPCGSLQQAQRCVGWYECRPIIEDYHKGMKTGCGIELPQMETIERLEPTIAILSVVAGVLFQLRQLARHKSHCDRPARTIVPARWVELLSLNHFGAKRDLSVKEFCLLLAALGGHQNRKGDGLPGWLTLWRGWTAFHLILQGATLAKGWRYV